MNGKILNAILGALDVEQGSAWFADDQGARWVATKEGLVCIVDEPAMATLHPWRDTGMPGLAVAAKSGVRDPDLTLTFQLPRLDLTVIADPDQKSHAGRVEFIRTAMKLAGRE